MIELFNKECAVHGFSKCLMDSPELKMEDFSDDDSLSDSADSANTDVTESYDLPHFLTEENYDFHLKG